MYLQTLLYLNTNIDIIIITVYGLGLNRKIY